MKRRELLWGSGYHLSWGGIFGGTFVALGVWILLYALGLAAGLTAIDGEGGTSLRAVGIGTGVWGIVAPLVALFCGGFVAARTGGLIDRSTGAIHGLVLWGLTTVAGLFLVFSLVGTLAGAGARLGSAAAGAVGQGQQMGQMLGVDTQDLLGPVNERLQREGLPPMTANELQAATRDVVARGVREGSVDRQALITSLTQNTRLNRAEAERVAANIEQQINQQGEQLKRGATAAAEAAGRAFWGVFFALLLGLVSAVAGGIVGCGRQAHELEETAPVVTPPPTGVVPERPAPTRT